MIPKGLDILNKIKELRNLSNDVSLKLETDGLSITNIPKEQLFANNIKNIITAVESILRNEPPEKPRLRLEKDIPDAYNNIKKLQETPQGKSNAAFLQRIKEIISYVEQNYKNL